MLNKLQSLFSTVTSSDASQLTSKDKLNDLIAIMISRKIINEQDSDMLKLHVTDFPIDFEHFIASIRQIYSLDIEKQINYKIIEFNKIKAQNQNFLNIFGMEALSNEDLFELMTIANKSYENLENSVKQLKRSEFVISNLRDEVVNFLWNPILENAREQTEEDNPEFFVVTK